MADDGIIEIENQDEIIFVIENPDIDRQIQLVQQRYIESLRDDVVIHNPKYRILETIATLMADVNATAYFTHFCQSSGNHVYHRSMFSNDINFREFAGNNEHHYVELSSLFNHFFEIFDEVQIYAVLEINEFRFDDTINTLYEQLMRNFETDIPQHMRENFNFKWMCAQTLMIIFGMTVEKYLQYHIDRIRENVDNPAISEPIVQSVRNTIMCPDFSNVSIIYPYTGLLQFFKQSQYTIIMNLFYTREFHSFFKQNLIGSNIFCPQQYIQQCVEFNTSLLETAISFQNFEQFTILIDEFEVDQHQNENSIQLIAVYSQVFLTFIPNDEQVHINHDMINQFLTKITELLTVLQRQQFIRHILRPLLSHIDQYDDYRRYYNVFIDWIQNDYDIEGIILPEIHPNRFNRVRFLRNHEREREHEFE